MGNSKKNQKKNAKTYNNDKCEENRADEREHCLTFEHFLQETLRLLQNMREIRAESLISCVFLLFIQQTRADIRVRFEKFCVFAVSDCAFDFQAGNLNKTQKIVKNSKKMTKKQRKIKETHLHQVKVQEIYESETRENRGNRDCSGFAEHFCR